VRIVSILPVLFALTPAAGAQTAAPAPPSTVTITAQRIARPLTVDGRFDDDMYQELSPFTEFVQQDPREGDPASERTELWVAFDEENIYFAVKCYHSDPDRIIATELRRDSSLIDLAELGPAALRQFFGAGRQHTPDRHAEREDGADQLHSVQRQLAHDERQPAFALGVSSRQRAVRGVQRRPEDVDRRLS
jgi:hypothetical protein